MTRVVDANVFMRGSSAPFDEAVTVPGVRKEIESDSSEIRFDLSGVEVEKPDERSLEKVKSISDEINSPTSEVDEELVALALEIDGVLVTDDMALQNLALHLDVEFDSYMGDRADDKRRWNEICPKCGREVEGSCGRCGAESTLKPE